jgi:hypothetical protein
MRRDLERLKMVGIAIVGAGSASPSAYRAPIVYRIFKRIRTITRAKDLRRRPCEKMRTTKINVGKELALTSTIH